MPEVSIIHFYHDNIKFYSTTSRRLKSETLNGYIPLQNKFKMKTWSVPKIDCHFVTFLVGIKESSIIFFLSIIKLCEQDSG